MQQNLDPRFVYIFCDQIISDSPDNNRNYTYCGVFYHVKISAIKFSLKEGCNNYQIQKQIKKHEFRRTLS